MPLIFITLIGLFYINIDNIFPLTNGRFSIVESLMGSISLTLFTFIGLESSTIPTENISNPSNVILFATVIVSLIYLSTILVLMGIIAPIKLAQSYSPFLIHLIIFLVYGGLVAL